MHSSLYQIDARTTYSCFSISAILARNMGEITVQNEPYCAMKWLRLKREA